MGTTPSCRLRTLLPSRLLFRALVGALGFAVLSVAPSAAQPREPIYLQYDGFVKNKDGTYTLSFGYFNTNHVDVTVPVGPDNSFLPGPTDARQQEVFLAGRHRFACIVVMDKGFDGKLQWQVRFAGTPSTTTARVLDSLYELELNSERRVLNGLDLTKPSFGVCNNRAPSVQVVNREAFAALAAAFGADADAVDPAAVAAFTGAGGGGAFGAALQGPPSFATRVDQELALTGVVDDDALPRGSRLTSSWKKRSGPGNVTFSDPTTPATRARFGAPGDYELELSATDTERTTSIQVKVRVAPTGSGEKPPETYSKTMKDANAAVQALRRDVEVKDHGAIANAAVLLGGLLTRVEEFWAGRKIDDATAAAKSGIKAAADLEAAAKAKNDSGIAASARALNAACAACHAVHRERLADGSFEIK